jgi:hypothetical protein
MAKIEKNMRLNQETIQRHTHEILQKVEVLETSLKGVLLKLDQFTDETYKMEASAEANSPTY